MARIYDNIETKFTTGLQGIIGNTSVTHIDFCIGYFNLRGWNLVMEQVDLLPGEEIYEQDERKHRVCRLLIGMHRPDEELVRRLYSKNEQLPDAEFALQSKRLIAQDFKRQLQLGKPTKADEETLRHLSAQMKAGKVCVKLYLKEPLHAKLYLAYRPKDTFNPIQAIMGSSNLTYAGLTKQGELNAEFSDSDSAQKLANWFDDRWNDRFCLDLTEELIRIIDESWAGETPIPPYYIYLKTAYHLSQDARESIGEYKLDAQFRHDLLDFQQIAVKIAAKRLSSDKLGGAMIGDVVGLGKTITACAIAKIVEQSYSGSTLIICPANLQTMWEKYKNKYDLKVEIRSMAKTMDPDQMPSFRLVIIDESHNLRNASGQRYQQIRRLIEKLDCKVLLLTATPFNKDFRDLGNQLRLFIDPDQDLGIRPEAYIQSIGGEREFQRRHSDIHMRSIRAFEQSQHTEDWSELIKMFLIRRTRTFIKENYAKEDKETHRKYLLLPDGTKSFFPDRIPRTVKFQTAAGDQYSRLYSNEMVDLMKSLKLPRYGLIKYFDEKKATDMTLQEKQIKEHLSRAGERMMGFCKSTFFKRIDSSGYAFLLTVYRHILRNALFIYAIENKLLLPIGDENGFADDYVEDEDSNQSLFNEANQGNTSEKGMILTFPTELDCYKQLAKRYYERLTKQDNCSWIHSEYFKRTLKQQLTKDCEQLIQMIQLCGQWEPDQDPKLNALECLLRETHPNDKIVVFTQFSDTANYVAKQLQKRGLKQVISVTGDSQKPTEIVERFSPVSNGKYYSREEQYRVLIATDVLSEGQNLQDAHIVCCFDMPWAIVRLIQRVGRVDRIGQNAPQIYCHSFMPEDGLEERIHLKQRLNDRINANANIVGSDEYFFEGNEKNLRDMYNEKSGILDEERDDEVDLSSQAFQIWKNATEADPTLKEIIPTLNNVVYSTQSTSNALEGGVITYAKTRNDFDVLTWLDTSGNIVSQSQKRILSAMACDRNTSAAEPLANHHELVAKAIERLENETITYGGALGNRFTTRFRISRLLEQYYSQPNTLFFTQEKKELLKLAIDDIYNFPLLESAKGTLGRMLRNSTPDEIVDTILAMRQDGCFCRVEEDPNRKKEPSIICSMGLTQES